MQSGEDKDICTDMIHKAVFFLLLFLGGCAKVGPNFKEPLKPVVTHWKKENALVKEKPNTNPLWWHTFHDPVLTKLIQLGYKHNLDLRNAGVRVLQARAQLAQATGELYPQQQALMGNYTYNRIGGSSLESVLPQSFNTAELGFSANWELDFWGKYRRAIASNNASFLASIAAYDYALVTLTSDIARAYIKIRTTESQIKVTKANIDVQQMGLNIARSRFNAGQASLVDVEQAQTELSQTQAKLPSLRLELQRQKDALSVLLGQIPNQLDCLLNEGRGIPKAPVSIAVGIPKESLIRRPDIYQARMEAIAQSEAIGAIKANLYPSFTLAGTFAFASNNIGNSSISELFQWANRTAAAGPGVNWPVLNYGQITNQVRVQDAAFQQALQTYLNTVLKAQQEVQDDITSFIEAKHAQIYLAKANQSAMKAFKLALIRYKEGETDFTPVLNAEQQQLRVQLSLINAEGDIPQAVVALYRSLGGGWQIRKGQDILPEPVKRQMTKRTNWGGLLKEANHRPPRNKAEVIQQLYLPKW